MVKQSVIFLPQKCNLAESWHKLYQHKATLTNAIGILLFQSFISFLKTSYEPFENSPNFYMYFKTPHPRKQNRQRSKT